MGSIHEIAWHPAGPAMYQAGPAGIKLLFLVKGFELTQNRNPSNGRWFPV